MRLIPGQRDAWGGERFCSFHFLKHLMVFRSGECWQKTHCTGLSYHLSVLWLFNGSVGHSLSSPGLAPLSLNPILPKAVLFWLFPTSAMVAQPVEKSCVESVQPFLASILEELMGPVSSGFSEVRSLFEKEVDELNQNFQTTKDSAQLKEVG